MNLDFIADSKTLRLDQLTEGRMFKVVGNTALLFLKGALLNNGYQYYSFAEGAEHPTLNLFQGGQSIIPHEIVLLHARAC